MRNLARLLVLLLLIVVSIHVAPNTSAQEGVTAPTKNEVQSWGEGVYGVYQPQTAVHKNGEYSDEYFVWAPFPVIGSTDVPTASLVIPTRFENADWYIMPPNNQPTYGRGGTTLSGFKWAFVRLNLAGTPPDVPMGLTYDQVKAWGTEAGRMAGSPYYFLWTTDQKGVGLLVPEVMTTGVRYYWFDTKRQMHFGEGTGTIPSMYWAIVIPTAR